MISFPPSVALSTENVMQISIRNLNVVFKSAVLKRCIEARFLPNIHSEDELIFFSLMTNNLEIMYVF